MDHLGEQISGIPELKVPLRTDLGSDYKTCNFHVFPVENGWEVDSRRPTPNINIGDPDPRDHRWSFERFAQRWLFFEVLRAVLGDDPKFSEYDFITADGQWIHTRHLQGYLERWELRERAERNSAKRISRMIKVIQVLDRARAYVSTHCAVEKAGANSHWAIKDTISLSFMVLGETLTRAMIRVQQATDFKVAGWHNHDPSSLGWGYSKAVLVMLEKKGWCVKTVRMLQSLFRGNTIGLLYAIPFANVALEGFHVLNSRIDPRWHVECSSTVCKAPALRAADAVLAQRGTSNSTESTPYPFHHHEDNCPDRSKCKMMGPESAELAKILDDGMVPVLKYDRKNSTLKVVPMAHWNQEYAIFSHVWADGFGNPHENKIFECNLKLFSDLFDDLRPELVPHIGPPGSQGLRSMETLFWIDTLAIPVGEKFKSQTKKALERMHDVYLHASYTIVLDAGLMKTPVESNYAGPAMRITMSAWMTRLWTLQEAVLSRHLYFNFSDRLCSMTRLEEQFYREDRDIHTCVPAVARAYYHGILGTERFHLHYTKVPIEKRKSQAAFVGEVWKASQWRTTSNPAHETLSLATLLNLKAGDFADSANTTGKESAPGKTPDARMRELLVLLAESNPCAIPPGMIFLPGPKLTEPGFRWAPRTWLSSQEVLSPDPLSLEVPDSILHQYGLEVQFPGFILHKVSNEGYCLQDHQEFFFPTDLRLFEWYHVQRIDQGRAEQFPSDQDLQDREGNPYHLAIIASTLPVIHEKTIALLVIILRSPSGRHDVRISNRVWLSRQIHSPNQDRSSESIEARMTNFRKEQFNKLLCGEKVDANQRWCVDGPESQEDADDEYRAPPPMRSARLSMKAIMNIAMVSVGGGQRMARS